MLVTYPKTACLLALSLASCARPTGDPPVGSAVATAAASVEATAAPIPRAKAEPSPPPRPARPIARLARLGEAGSALALGTLDGKRLAFVADADDRAVHTVDVDKGIDIARTPLVGTPSALVIATDGRIYVGLRSGSAVQILAATGAADEPLSDVGTLAAAREPVGLTVTANGEKLLVVTGISHQLLSFALPSGVRTDSVDLPRDPRAVIMHGDTAFVSHLAGSTMSVVDLESDTREVEHIDLTGGMPYFVLHETDDCRGPHSPAFDSETPMPAAQGFSLVEAEGNILVPQVNALTQDAGSSAPGYGASGLTQFGRVAAIEIKNRALRRPSVTPHGWPGAQCLLPRSVARNPIRSSILIACLGSDEVQERAVNDQGAYDDGSDPRRWKVPAGPVALAVDPEARRVIVFSQFDRAISIIDLAKDQREWGSFSKAASFHLSPLSEPMAADIDEGRRLFHRTSVRIAVDGRACASCHPDGRDDGMIWNTPRGPRRTPSLAGRIADTAPYDWEGDHPDLADHITRTIKERLHGQGLSGHEIAALAAYVSSLPNPASPEGELGEAAARGKEIFRSAETDCAGCHSGNAMTDGHSHDVGSGGRFDTPSLLSAGSLGPYFHDGRYATLEELLRATDGRMGHTAQLDAGARSDLLAYLESF